MSERKLPEGMVSAEDVADELRVQISETEGDDKSIDGLTCNAFDERDAQWSAALARVEAERDDARAYGEKAAKAHNDLLAQMTALTLTCAYCGHEYPAGTPASGHVTLTEHIAVCEKHPLRAANAALAAAQARIAELRETLNELCMSVDDLDAEEAGEGRNLFVSPGCLVCTSGTTPDHLNTGLCAYHKATSALARPDDDSALRWIVTKAVDGGFDEGTAWMTRSGEMSSATRRDAIVARVLGGE